VGKLPRSFMGVLAGSFLLAAIANPAMAEDMGKAAKAEKGKSVRTVMAENEKVMAWELRYAPGATNTSPPTSSTRVVRAIKGGEQLWTFADGTTKKNVWKTGEVRILSPGPGFTSKNVGKTEILLYTVMLK